MKIIGNYENRLRKFSSPQKIFDYFASSHGYMTPEDLVRALTPFTPGQNASMVGSKNFKYTFYVPQELDAREKVKYKELLNRVMSGDETAQKALRRFRREHDISTEYHLRLLQEFGVSSSDYYNSDTFVHLVDLNGDGLISFQEFMLLMLFLSRTEREYRQLFKEASAGANTIEAHQFDSFLKAIQDLNSGEWRLRRRNTQSALIDDADTFLLLQNKLFNGKETISFDEFIEFIRKLRYHVEQLAFQQFDEQGTDALTPYQLALYIISCHAEESSRASLAQRAEQLVANSETGCVITFDEFSEFSKFIRSIHAVMKEMRSLELHEGVSKGELIDLATSVAEANLSDEVATVIFCLLDADGDGHLTLDEIMNALGSDHIRSIARTGSRL